MGKTLWYIPSCPKQTVQYQPKTFSCCYRRIWEHIPLLKPLRQLEDNEYFGLKYSSMITSISRHGHPSLRSNRHTKRLVDGTRITGAFLHL